MDGQKIRDEIKEMEKKEKGWKIGRAEEAIYHHSYTFFLFRGKRKWMAV